MCKLFCFLLLDMEYEKMCLITGKKELTNLSNFHRYKRLVNFI